jgi:carbon monoxide dehydrogenase subunit G
MLSFEGQKSFPKHTPDVLFPKLSDARFLVTCVPDVSAVKQQEEAQAVLTLRPGFAFIRGTLDVTMRVTEVVPPSNVLLNLHSKGIGSSSEVEVRLTVVAEETGSRVNWSAEVKSLGGLLKAVPRGLIRGAAQKVVEDAWKSVEVRLDEAAGS